MAVSCLILKLNLYCLEKTDYFARKEKKQVTLDILVHFLSIRLLEMGVLPITSLHLLLHTFLQKNSDT